jgi:hypothetical protein
MVKIFTTELRIGGLGSIIGMRVWDSRYYQWQCGLAQQSTAYSEQIGSWQRARTHLPLHTWHSLRNCPHTNTHTAFSAVTVVLVASSLGTSFPQGWACCANNYVGSISVELRTQCHSRKVTRTDKTCIEMGKVWVLRLVHIGHWNEEWVLLMWWKISSVTHCYLYSGATINCCDYIREINPQAS